MKGIVFTEFLEMVESSFGYEVVDTIIENSNLPSKGAYTAVGTYAFSEMVELLTNLSSAVKISSQELLYTFGRFLFHSLERVHPEIIQNFKDPIHLLNAIEDHIHIQVKKLYPEAELPSFKILSKTSTSISMVYCSSRGLYALAHGLIEETFVRFEQSASISYELLTDNGSEVKFDIQRNEQ